MKGITRREVLLPGEILSRFIPGVGVEGRHHGIITRVVRHETGGEVQEEEVAVVSLTDFKKVKLQLALGQVVPFLVPKKEGPPRAKPSGWKRGQAAERAPPPKKPKKAPKGVPLHGPPLLQHMRELGEARSAALPPGTRVWVKVAGAGPCRWPGHAWAFDLCKRRDMGELILSYRKDMMLVRFFGEHSSMWVREGDCELPPPDEGELIRLFKAWARAHNKPRLLELALDEMAGAEADAGAEVRRVLQTYDRYEALSASRAHPSAGSTCYLCREPGADLDCAYCERQFHPLCLRSPAVAAEHLPAARWTCPCCGEDQAVGEVHADDEGDPDRKVERMGLTPDWMIEAAAFHVFQLPRPTAERPYIAGLLDPCTNSKLAPNIPAERLYDKRDDGLRLANAWAGHHVLLNPDYSAQVQWRFVNRAIDEVENDQVPAVVLICRNSTDTGYFQRLRPYPRVLLRRMSARFKDYDKTPIGFGIACFCIATLPDASELYSRFFDAFEPMGEPNIPVDKTFMQSQEFTALLERLRGYAAIHHRDHWAQCGLCQKWRIVDFKAAGAISAEDDWTCRDLSPPYSSCHTPLSRGEALGGRYSAGGADGLDLAGTAAGGAGNAEGTPSQADAVPRGTPETDTGGVPAVGSSSDAGAVPPAGMSPQPEWPPFLAMAPPALFAPLRQAFLHMQACSAAAAAAGLPAPRWPPLLLQQLQLAAAAAPHLQAQLSLPVQPQTPQQQQQSAAGGGVAGGPRSLSALVKAAAPPRVPPSEFVASEKELHEHIRLPPRNVSLDTESGMSGQVLTALELARQARIAANRAYLASLKLPPKAMHAGEVSLLAPDHPTMLAAARELARRAAVEEGRRQLEEVRRQYEAAQRRRHREEGALLAALEEVRGGEAAAAAQLRAAEEAVQQLEEELRG